MKIESLRRLALWVEKIVKALSDVSAELNAELAAAEKQQQDPLGLHIYQARRSYRMTSEADKNKSGRKTALEVQTSFFRARELGFRPGRDVWEEVLRCGLPHVAAQDPKAPIARPP